MSSRASNLLSIFGMFSLLMLALYLISLTGFKESSGVFFIAFNVALAMIPVSFIIHWLLEIKHEWDMRVVTVVSPNGDVFPQNAINAKKAGYKFRRPTKDERIKWKLDKREKLSVFIRKLWKITNEEIQAKQIAAKLNDPDLPIEEFIRIRSEQESQKNS